VNPGIPFGLIDERRLNPAHQVRDLVDRVAQPQAQIGRDLVVAGARRVQPLARVSHDSDEPPLDVEVDILRVERPAEAPRLDFVRDPRQAALDRLEVGLAQNPRCPQHARVRERRPDVVQRKAPVKCDRGRVALDELGYRLGEPPGPGLFARLGLRFHG
jgi:hypothetical protein